MDVLNPLLYLCRLYPLLWSYKPRWLSTVQYKLPYHDVSFLANLCFNMVKNRWNKILRNTSFLLCILDGYIPLRLQWFHSYYGYLTSEGLEMIRIVSVLNLSMIVLPFLTHFCAVYILHMCVTLTQCTRGFHSQWMNLFLALLLSDWLIL